MASVDNHIVNHSNMKEFVNGFIHGWASPLCVFTEMELTDYLEDIHELVLDMEIVGGDLRQGILAFRLQLEEKQDGAQWIEP